MSEVHTAAANCEKTRLEKLLNGGLFRKPRDVNETDSNGETPLHHAASAGDDNYRIVDLLIEKGANIDARSNEGLSPLMVACANGHTMVVKLLLDRGANVSIVNSGGHTAMHIAAESGCQEAVESLVASGGDLTANSAEDLTPVDFAAANGHSELAVLMYRRGAVSNNQELNAVLQEFTKMLQFKEALASGDVSAIRQELENGWDIAGDKGTESLAIAAREGQLEIVLLLLAHGVGVDAQNEIGRTAMHQAAKGGHPDVIQVLLDKGASVNIADQKGVTPLHLASGLGVPRFTWVQSQEGGQIAVDRKTLKVFDIEAPGYCQSVELLLNNGAAINATTNDGHTPLREAKASRVEKLVLILRERGASGPRTINRRS